VVSTGVANDLQVNSRQMATNNSHASPGKRGEQHLEGIS
jgi:hypothetical protein